MTDRLAELEAQAAALAAEIAALRAAQPAPTPTPQPRDERSFSVTPLLVEITSGLPNLAEFKKLYAVVKNLVPETKHHDPDAGFRGFCGAYRFVSNCGRVAVPNAKVSISWWLDTMINWLRQRGAVARDVSGASFVAAIYASGDICYVPHSGANGTVWEFAIVPPDQIGAKPASPDSWKRILREGASAILPPSAPARRMPEPSNVRIYGGA
jgi:hypothetical protein